MSAGTAYSKRYAGGFADLPSQTTAIDSTFLNAVETALLQLIGAAPTADGQVAQWDNANTRFGPALILNKNVDAAAAIASSKIDFTGGNALTNAAIAGAAAIARSKLDFGSGLVNADIATNAAIAPSKLAAMFGTPSTSLPGSPTDGQVCILTDSTAAPTYYWLLVYNTTAAKWQFVGGSPIYASVETNQAVGSTGSYVDLATVGPTFTIPKAGDYFIGAGFSSTDLTNPAEAKWNIGGSLVGIDMQGTTNTTGNMSTSENWRVQQFTALAAGATAKLQYKSGNTATTFQNRWAQCWPIQIA